MSSRKTTRGERLAIMALFRVGYNTWEGEFRPISWALLATLSQGKNYMSHIYSVKTEATRARRADSHSRCQLDAGVIV